MEHFDLATAILIFSYIVCKFVTDGFMAVKVYIAEHFKDIHVIYSYLVYIFS